MRIPWLQTRAPVDITVHDLHTEVLRANSTLEGTLKLRARRPVLIKTTAFRVFSLPPKQQEATVYSLSNHVVILDRSLAKGECLEMPIQMVLPPKALQSLNTLSLSVEVATHPDRPKSEWRGEFAIYSTP